MLGEVIAPDPPPGLTPLETPPTFSVLVSVYQMAHVVREALDSILAQTVPPREIIVCDDGSTDDFDSALAPYADRVTVVRQEHKGLPSAYNAALSRATSEFIISCDADDVQFPTLLESLGMLAMQRPDLDILGRGMELQLFGKRVGPALTPHQGPFPTEDQRQGIMRNNFLFACSAARRRRVLDIGGADEAMVCASDYDLWLRLILSGCRAGLVAQPLGTYRFGPGSMSSNEVASKSGRLYALTKALSRDDLSGAERELVQNRVRDVEEQLEQAKQRAGARAALLGGRGARRQCLRLSLNRTQPARTRVKAMSAVVAPRLAARRLARAAVS